MFPGRPAQHRWRWAPGDGRRFERHVAMDGTGRLSVLRARFGAAPPCAFLPVAPLARRPFGLAGLPGSNSATTPTFLAAPTAPDLWRRQPSQPWALQVRQYVSAQAARLPGHRPTGVGTPLSPLRSESDAIRWERERG